MSLFPVCCYTCRKVINPMYETFKAGVREIQTMEDVSKLEKHDRVTGLLCELGIRRLCCRIIFLSHVDSFDDEQNMRGCQLGKCSDGRGDQRDGEHREDSPDGRWQTQTRICSVGPLMGALEFLGPRECVLVRKGVMG